MNMNTTIVSINLKLNRDQTLPESHHMVSPINMVRKIFSKALAHKIKNKSIHL